MNSMCERQRVNNSVQIVGFDPVMMRDAAVAAVEHGAEIVDINMGCPAKKVCKKAAGSALLRDEPLVQAILREVVHAMNAVDIPVTLKIRTGWDDSQKNAVTIGKIAEQNGIQSLAIHGRTRAMRFNGEAEYQTIAEVKKALTIPVIANGDITSVEKALHILKHTAADGIMIGRGAQGQPWLFKQIKQAIAGNTICEPSFTEKKALILRHIQALHSFYGEYLGLRIARKHMAWYLPNLGFDRPYSKQFNAIAEHHRQIEFITALSQPAMVAKPVMH